MSSGNNNDDISSVTVDFSEFGGTVVSASNNSETWSTTYTIIEDTINSTNPNVSTTAIDDSGHNSTALDTSDVSVDSTTPKVDLFDNERDNVVKGDDIVIITAKFTEQMSASPQISILDGGVSSVNMVDSGDGKIWTYIWTVPFSDLSAIVTVSGFDVAGNAYTDSDMLEFLIDSTPPIITGVTNKSIYIESRVIYFNEGTAKLNEKFISIGTAVKRIDEYVLVVTDRAKNQSTVSFSIQLEKAITTSHKWHYNLIDIERESDDGKTNVMLNVDSDVLQTIIDLDHEDKTISISVLDSIYDKSIKSYYLCMTLANIENMRDSDIVIILDTLLGSFELNPNFIDMSRLYKSFPGIGSNDIEVKLIIKPAHYYRNYAINRLAELSGYIVTTDSVTFDLRCNYEEKIVVSANFTESVTVLLPIKDADALLDLTAIRLMPDMTLKISKATIINSNGKYYAKFSSTINGTFAIIYSK